MRRLELSLLGCLLACCLTSCAANSNAEPTAGAADPAADAANWQGTWKLVSCKWNGEPQPGDVQWIVSGDHYNIRLDGQTGTDPYTFTLDARKKQIDVFHHDTPQGTYGGKLKGIYEINGDSLKICYELTGERYPKSFDAGPGSRQVLYQFQRESR
jgi:uncharacterized protein (TIGR03067 family)